MLRILGIDPGSVRMGYGVIDTDGQQSWHRAHGCIQAGHGTLGEKLARIAEELQAVITDWQPAHMAIEDVFMAKNAQSALKLGQARGAAICIGVQQQLTINEYSARRVKQSLVGSGGAQKEQVQHMVSLLLNIEHDLQADAADALAIAICHAHTHSQPALNQTTKTVTTVNGEVIDLTDSLRRRSRRKNRRLFRLPDA